MAVAIGFGVYELGLLAAAGTAAYLATPAGQKAVKATGELVGATVDAAEEGAKNLYNMATEALSNAKSKPISPAIPKTIPKSTHGCGPGIKPECCKAAKDIDDVVNGTSDNKSMEKRYDEMYEDKGSQPWFAEEGQKSNRMTRWGHVLRLFEMQKQLKKAMETYFAHGCTNLDPETLKKMGDELMKDVLEEVLKRGTLPK